MVLLFVVLSGCGDAGQMQVPENSGNPVQETSGENVQDVYLHLSRDGYVVIFDEACSRYEEQAIKVFKEFLGAEFVFAEDEETPPGTYEILIGQTNRPESVELGKGLGVNDYRIAVEDQKLVLAGGSDDAVINAIAVLMRDEAALLKSDAGELSISREYSASFNGADTREEYLANIDLFLCNWAAEFETPEWMLNWEEKWTSLQDPMGRMMLMHHRADYYHYPENSLEAVISSLKMGADAIEVDPRLTKDNVVVLLHDGTLERTTDWEEKKGRNGLPDSPKLTDWTYEQLCQLRLLDTKTKEPTEYIIPTLQEVLQVCKGRAFLFLDKCGVWDWNTHIYPLIKETEAWQVCFACRYGIDGQQITIAETIKADSGLDTAMLWQYFTTDDHENWQEEYDAILQTGYSPIIWWYDLSAPDPRKSVERVGEDMDVLRGNAGIMSFLHLLNGGTEKWEDFDYLQENGVNLITIDKALPGQQYIADRYTEN